MEDIEPWCSQIPGPEQNGIPIVIQFKYPFPEVFYPRRKLKKRIGDFIRIKPQLTKAHAKRRALHESLRIFAVICRKAVQV
jgi:hypothetical protein